VIGLDLDALFTGRLLSIMLGLAQALMKYLWLLLWVQLAMAQAPSSALMQNYGRTNTVRNNLFALSQDCHLLMAIREDHLSLILERNIVYWDQGILFAGNWSIGSNAPPAGTDSPSHQQHPDTGCRHFLADYNTYYRVRPGSPSFAGASFEQWKQRGNDVHSILADPEFVAVHLRNFALRPSSPALKQGFEPVDLSTVGPRPGRLPNE